MMRTVFSLIVLLNLFCHSTTLASVELAPKEESYKNPIGFSLNIGSVLSFTAEGRFQLGLIRGLSLILSPSYQNTLEIPWYHPERKYEALFDIRRLNLGAGLRCHFYDFDSRDGWFIEPMGRVGFTWIGTDPRLWSVIPSLMFGYAVVYDIGYTVSFGLGLEYEFLFGDKDNYYIEHLTSAYFGFTKLPIMGEFSIGWTW